MENKKLHGPKPASPRAPRCAFCHIRKATESICECDTGKEVLICTVCDSRMEWHAAVEEIQSHNGGEHMSERFETYCCGQPMRCLGLVDFLAPEVESIRRWVCEVCGHGIDLVRYNFDELELQNELELYGDEPSPAHIQQVKGGDLENGR